MPDFGLKITAAPTEFEQWVSNQRFKHPETGKLDKYVSLPSEEQKRIYQEWKSRKQPQTETPAPSQPVQDDPGFEVDPSWIPLDLSDVFQGDIVAFEINGQMAMGEVYSYKGQPPAVKSVKIRSINPETGEADGKHDLELDKDGIKQHNVFLAQGAEFVDTEPEAETPTETPKSEAPSFEINPKWAPVKMNDIYDWDVVAYEFDGKPQMAMVTRLTGKPPKVTKFRVSPLDPHTGHLDKSRSYEFEPKDLKKLKVVLVPAEQAPKPVSSPEKPKIKPHWKPVRLDDLYKTDVIAFEDGGNVQFGLVTQTTGTPPKVTSFRVSPYDFYTGNADESKHIDFDAKTIKERKAVLVPPKETWAASKGQVVKELSPEEKAKLEQEKKERAEKRAKAVEAMGKIGAPIKKLGDIKEDDVVVFQDNGDIHYGRVIETGDTSASFLYINPEDGKILSPKYDKLRANDLSGFDVHSVNEEHRPANPKKHNILEVLKSLTVFPEDPERFFLQPKDMQLIDMGAIKPSKVRLKGVISANQLMGQLLGEKPLGARRDPVSLIDNGDGSYSVRDGNSTFTNARLSKWKKLPAIVKTKEQWDEFDRLEKERKKQEHEKWLAEYAKKNPGKSQTSWWGDGGLFSESGDEKSQKKKKAVHSAIVAYRPLWQDNPGYKTVVTDKSEKGILPSDTESTSPDRGQSNLDSMWPVEETQTREKERALPLPSNHDKLRDKRIGPTYVNKPRVVPYRTRSEKGDEYGHPTKFDYNYVRRRQDVTAALEKDLAFLEKLAVLPLPKPGDRQKNLPVGYQREMHRDYLRRRPRKKLRTKLQYRTRGKRDAQQKRYRKYYRKYPGRYKRRGKSPYDTPAERSKAWREQQKRQEGDTGLSSKELKDIRERSPSTLRSRKPAPPGRKVYAHVEHFFDMVMRVVAAQWPSDWETQVKKTVSPEQLSQNHEPEQSKSTTPRKDPDKQKGESLRAPNLDGKPQKGLKWEILPKAPGGMPSYTTNNPGSGSGKVIPMWGDFANNTQQVPDDNSDQYLRNDNYDVKVARTLPEILHHVDPKIKERAAHLSPTLERSDTKNWIWHWRVGEHAVKVQAFQQGAAKNFPKLNLRLSCSCPAWRWWGSEHWASEEDYLRGSLQGSGEKPSIRDPEHWRPVCKHAYAVLMHSQEFFVRPDKSPLKKLGTRFSLDNLASIEVEPMYLQAAAAASVERSLAQVVARRYVEDKEA